MSNGNWREKRKQRKQCAGPSCPAPRSKPKTKKYHTPNTPKTGIPKHDKPASDWTASTTTKTTPASTARRSSYSKSGGTREGHLGSMDLPSGKPLTTKQLQGMRKAAGFVIKYKGKPINPKARTQ